MNRSTWTPLSLLGALATLAVVLLGSLFFARQTLPASAAVATSLQPIVTDAQGRAVAGARVVVHETGMTYTTDSSGRTPAIILTGLERAEVTLLVYAQGYGETLLAHVTVYPDQLRIGPTITLPPLEQGAQWSCEPPEAAWAKELLGRYRP